jgi:hypothetical protein
MKKLILIFFLFHFFILSAQINEYERNIINDIIKERFISNNEMAILYKHQYVFYNEHLKELVFNKTKTFASEENKNEKIILTESERNSILKSLTKNSSYKWLKEDIPNYKILYSDNTRDFLKENGNTNSLLIISRPTFIRNGEVAVVFYSHTNYRKKIGGSDLCFYKNNNGVWKKWIVISSKNTKI